MNLRSAGLFLSLFLFLLEAQAAAPFCAEVFPQQWASEIITSNFRDAPRIQDDNLYSTGRVERLIEKPYRLRDIDEARQPVSVGPIIVHRLDAFPKHFQEVILDLFQRSFRSSWLNEASRHYAQEYYEILGEKNNVSTQEAQRFYNREAEPHWKVLRDQKRMLEDRGIEVAQIVVAFKDGSFLKSNFHTSYLVDAIFDPTAKAEAFIRSLPSKAIESVHFFHTHPTDFVGSAGALSIADVKSLKDFRIEFSQARPQQNFDGVPFHMYAVAPMRRRILVGHYSEIFN